MEKNIRQYHEVCGWSFFHFVGKLHFWEMMIGQRMAFQISGFTDLMMMKRVIKAMQNSMS